MIKKKKNYKPEEVGILLEDIREQISVVAEQNGGMSKDIKTMKTDLSAVREDVEIIKLDIEFIKNELKNKIARDEFVALERRVSLLENRR